MGGRGQSDRVKIVGVSGDEDGGAGWVWARLDLVEMPSYAPAVTRVSVYLGTYLKCSTAE